VAKPWRILRDAVAARQPARFERSSWPPSSESSDLARAERCGCVEFALAGGFAASALRQSPILGYLLGCVIRPSTPGFVGNQSQTAALADVGVIFLPLGLGVAFSPKDLARARTRNDRHAQHALSNRSMKKRRVARVRTW